MSGEILWVDNDRAYLGPYCDALRGAGFHVTTVDSLTAAEAALAQRPYALLLLDVMIPTIDAEEERIYPPEQTGRGYITGLVFWRRNRALLENAGTPVLVFTVRLDENIREEFAAEGLPVANFATKYELSEPDVFVQKVRQIIDAGGAKK